MQIQSGVSTSFITPEALKNKIYNNESPFILDVREPFEHENWRIDGSANIPLGTLKENMNVIPKDKEIVTVCLHGIRSERARQMLAGLGYKARTMAGGMVAWNSIYDIVEVPANFSAVKVREENKPAASKAKEKSSEYSHYSLHVLQFRRIGKGCLSYMVISGKETAVIDPAFDANVYIEAAKSRGAEIVAVLDTHTHADHVSGGWRLADIMGCNYYSPDNKIKHEHENIENGATITIGSAVINAVHTPGHTPESVTYILGSLAFTGDTLFVESVGRPDLGQDAKTNGVFLWETLNNVFIALPDSTKILPSHYSKNLLSEKDRAIIASIGELKNNLKALKMSKNEFVDWISKSEMPKPPNFDVIKGINLGHELFADEDEIREIEAGPNRCAVV